MAGAELSLVRVQDYAIQDPVLGPVPPFRSYQEVVDALAGETGEGDTFTVDPVDWAGRALQEAGNHEATVLVFPDTGHFMNVTWPGADTGMTSEQAGYLFHNFRFAGGFLDIVRSWAAARAGTPWLPVA